MQGASEEGKFIVADAADDISSLGGRQRGSDSEVATARLIWYIELRSNFLHLNYYGQDLPLAQLVTAYYIRGGGA